MICAVLKPTANWPGSYFRVGNAANTEPIEGEIAVKSLFQLALASLLALTVLLGASAPAAAQEGNSASSLKPVAIVSVASIKENLADIGYVTRAAGMPDYGDTAKFFAGALTSGLDKQRPSGLYVVPQGGDFHAIAFLPLDAGGLATILKVHKEHWGAEGCRRRYSRNRQQQDRVCERAVGVGLCRGKQRALDRAAAGPRFAAWRPAEELQHRGQTAGAKYSR